MIVSLMGFCRFGLNSSFFFFEFACRYLFVENWIDLL